MHNDKGCLTEAELGAYLEGRVSAEKRAEVEKVLADCPDCLAEAVNIKRIISDPSAADLSGLDAGAVQRAAALFPARSQVFDAVISVLNDAIRVIRSSPLAAWSYAAPALGLRHTKALSPSMIVLTRTFNGLKAELDIEQIAECICNLKIRISPVSPDISLQGIRVELFSGERELASEFLSAGNVLFEDMGCGDYVVSVRKKEIVFGEITLRIE